jgi:hypothetical protein
LAPSSPLTSPDARSILEAQIRECFGRVVYSHKTQEKCADILLARLGWIKVSQIVLAALTAGGGTTATFDIKGYGSAGAAVATILATILLGLNLFTKNNDLGQQAQKHRQAGAALWLVREKYLSLITDLRMRVDAIASIVARRDALLEEAHAAYESAPATSTAGYTRAQEALKVKQDMTFTDGEIDAFLPAALRQDAAPAPAAPDPNSGAAKG